MGRVHSWGYCSVRMCLLGTYKVSDFSPTTGTKWAPSCFVFIMGTFVTLRGFHQNIQLHLWEVEHVDFSHGSTSPEPWPRGRQRHRDQSGLDSQLQGTLSKPFQGPTDVFSPPGGDGQEEHPESGPWPNAHTDIQ